MRRPADDTSQVAQRLTFIFVLFSPTVLALTFVPVHTLRSTLCACFFFGPFYVVLRRTRSFVLVQVSKRRCACVCACARVCGRMREKMESALNSAASLGGGHAHASSLPRCHGTGTACFPALQCACVRLCLVRASLAVTRSFVLKRRSRVLPCRHSDCDCKYRDFQLSSRNRAANASDER